jgi:hypothetical protein
MKRWVSSTNGWYAQLGVLLEALATSAKNKRSF